MTRIRVIREDGTWFLMEKGTTLSEAREWKNAFNKHQKRDVLIEEIKDRVERKRKKANQFGMPSFNDLMRM